MSESTIAALGVIFSITFWTWIVWLMKGSGWRPPVWIIAVAMVRQLVFCAKWITYSGRADMMTSLRTLTAESQLPA